MGALFILPVAAVSLWIIYSAFRHLRRGDVGAVWRSRVMVLLVVGTLLGVYFAFFKSSQPTKEFATQGFPVPYAIFKLQSEQWVRSEMPLLVRIGAHLADLLFGIALGLLPMKIMGVINQAKPDRPPGNEV